VAEFINTSPESLRTVAQSVSGYARTQTEVIDGCYRLLSAEAGDIQTAGFRDGLQEVCSMLSRMRECQEEIDRFSGILRQKAEELEALRSIGAGAPSGSSFRTKVAGTVAGAVLRTHVNAAGSDRKSVAGYVMDTAKKVVDAVGSVADVLSGASPAPQGPGTQAVDGQVELGIGLIDGHFAGKPGQSINREPTPVPQEQIDSHTLIVPDPNSADENG